ncbi:MAG: DUF3887 domain-containing protein [Actinomycetota bacterium]
MRAFIGVLAMAVVCAGCASTTPAPSAADDRLSPNDAAYALRAQDVVRQTVVGDFAKIRADFDEVMLAGLSEQQMRDAWMKFGGLYGPLVKQQTPQVLHVAVGTTVNIRLAMLKGPAQARVTFDDAGKISGLWFLRPDVPLPK